MKVEEVSPPSDIVVKEEKLVRKAVQPILPSGIDEFRRKSKDYDIYPYHSLGDGKISRGYKSLASWIAEQGTVLIDGYVGVFWDDVKTSLNKEFERLHVKVSWYDASAYFKSEKEIDLLAEPFLGTEGSVWGTKTGLVLQDFFQIDELRRLLPADTADVNIVIGTGASLATWEVPTIYFDLPKNELQYRMNAGSITNLGKASPENAVEMYKRFYFVDWVVLNEHKKSILDRLNIIVDAQALSSINWVQADDLFSGLQSISSSVFRVRPWFEPGAWGGQWLKDRIADLDQEAVNYAWSFELIVPENGLIFESNGALLEVSFDFLMFKEYPSVLGKHADTFKEEFPIRFDFLDTYGGGNLSIQCHPNLKYIQENFGEKITQDETYYILDCKEDAKVYLGFQDDIQPDEFRNVLEDSVTSGQEIEVEKFVQVHSSKKHELFLIPNGTVHSSGTNNLVLEISATPYIFTFKMYDWVRLGLNGKPRPINIEHAFRNLRFDRKGDRVRNELISKPYVREEGSDWQTYHLPTHPDHFYDVFRYEFESEILIENNNVCHIMMLVEGEAVRVETADGSTTQYNYAETFVVPAAAKSYKLVNLGSTRAKVVNAFLK